MRLCLKTAPKYVKNYSILILSSSKGLRSTNKLLICYPMSTLFLSATPTIWSRFLWCFLEPQPGGFIWDLSCLSIIAAFFLRLHIETVWHGHDGTCLQGELGGLFDSEYIAHSGSSRKSHFKRKKKNHCWDISLKMEVAFNELLEFS